MTIADEPAAMPSDRTGVSDVRGEALEDQELRDVLDESPDGIVVIDDEGVIRYANTTAVELLQPPDGDLVGTDFGFPVGSGLVPEIELRDRSGGVRAAEMRVTPVRRYGATAWVVALRDVTRRANAERALLRALQRREDALVVVSHQLRRPLALVTRVSQALLSYWDELDREERLELLTRIEGQSLRMSMMVDRLLEVARIDAGIPPRPERVALLDLVLERLHELGERASDLELAIPAEIHAQADPDHVWTILSNFVANAFQHGGPPVALTARVSGSWACIEVTDGGSGVDAKVLPHLFSRYAGSPRRGAGLGLGLWVALALAKANGGEVDYEPNQPGGARFSCYLPLPRDGERGR